MANRRPSGEQLGFDKVTCAKIDDVLNKYIFLSVKGESKLWPVDPAHKVGGNPEERYREGDKQILLWTINDYAQNGEPIPKWAAIELRHTLLRLAKGGLPSWDEAFGRRYSNGSHARRMHGMRRMLESYFLAVKLHNELGIPIGDALFEKVADILGIGQKNAKKFYYHAQKELPVSVRKELASRVGGFSS